MATATASVPRFVTALRGLDAEQRLAELSKAHPDYTSHLEAWQILLDAFEGSGGFLDGGYLWPYPREEQAQFDERRRMARYHNYLETLIEIYARQVFTESVKRTSKDPVYDLWTESAGGPGIPLTAVMKRACAMGLVGGHAGMLVDKTQEMPTGPRRADELAVPFVTVFPNVSITDWRFERERLVGVKLLEAPPPTPIVAPDTEPVDQQLLVWDTEGWARFDAKGEFVGGAITATLGMVPLVLLRPKASHISPMLGRPLIGNANIIRALYNRSSEEDEVLRAQAFSVLVVSVEAEADAEAVRASLGNTIGAAKAIVVKGAADYKTPSMEVPAAVRNNISFLVTEMYRSAHVRFRRSDSLAVEAADAIRLQHIELNEALQGLAQELQRAEREIARAYYAWTEPTEDAAQAAFERADPRTEYPDQFFIAELQADLEAWAFAIQMDLGDTFTKRIKKRAVRRVEPDIPPEDLRVIDEEIDAQEEAELQTPPTDFGPPDETGGLNEDTGGNQ